MSVKFLVRTILSLLFKRLVSRSPTHSRDSIQRTDSNGFYESFNKSIYVIFKHIKQAYKLILKMNIGLLFSLSLSYLENSYLVFCMMATLIHIRC